MGVVVGIDPGAKGAIAFYDTKKHSLMIYDMPMEKRGNLSLVDARQAYRIFKDLESTYKHVVTCIALEVVTAMPQDGVASAFKFGHRAGMIEAVARCACPFADLWPLRPAVWKAALGLTKNKEDSLFLARKTFPSHTAYFKLKKHDGRAEAALLAIATAKILYG